MYKTLFPPPPDNNSILSTIVLYLESNYYLKLFLPWFFPQIQTQQTCSYSNTDTPMSHSEKYPDIRSDYNLNRFKNFINTNEPNPFPVEKSQIFKASDTKLKLNSVGLYHFEFFIMDMKRINVPIEKFQAQLYKREVSTREVYTEDSEDGKDEGEIMLGTLFLQTIIHLLGTILIVYCFYMYIYNNYSSKNGGMGRMPNNANPDDEDYNELFVDPDEIFAEYQMKTRETEIAKMGNANMRRASRAAL